MEKKSPLSKIREKLALCAAYLDPECYKIDSSNKAIMPIIDEENEECKSVVKKLENAEFPIKIILFGNENIYKKAYLISRLMQNLQQNIKFENDMIIENILRLAERNEYMGISYNSFNINNKKFIIFDLPGHPDKIKKDSMILAEVAIFIFDENDKAVNFIDYTNSELFQQFLLLRKLNVQKIMILIDCELSNKNCEIYKSNFENMTQKLTKILLGVGFNIENNIFFIPTEITNTGQNICYFSHEFCEWYTGKSLLSILENIQLKSYQIKSKDIIRLIVLDAYEKLIIAKIISKNCELRLDQKIIVLPNKIIETIKSIEYIGLDYVKIEVSNTIEKIKSGDIISDIENLCPCFNQFIAEIHFFNLSTAYPIISLGFSSFLSINGQIVYFIISKMIKVQKITEKGLIQDKPLFARSNSIIECVINLENIISAEKYEIFSELGLFTIYCENNIIAIGKILKYKPL